MKTTDILYTTITTPEIIEGYVLPIVAGGLVVGAGLGIIGLIAIEIWSRIISIEARRNKSPKPQH